MSQYTRYCEPFCLVPGYAKNLLLKLINYFSNSSQQSPSYSFKYSQRCPTWSLRVTQCSLSSSLSIRISKKKCGAQLLESCSKKIFRAEYRCLSLCVYSRKYCWKYWSEKLCQNRIICSFGGHIVDVVMQKQTLVIACLFLKFRVLVCVRFRIIIWRLRIMNWRLLMMMC